MCLRSHSRDIIGEGRWGPVFTELVVVGSSSTGSPLTLVDFGAVWPAEAACLAASAFVSRRSN